MNKEQFIALLNQDLSNEYKHMLFYLHHAAMVSTIHRFEVREFLLEEAASEMKHVDEFAHVIVGLGGIPTTMHAAFDTNLTDPIEILQYAMDMENEVADNYAHRLIQTENLMESNAWAGCKADAGYVHVFMEDNLKDSRKTADELRVMLSAYRK